MSNSTPLELHVSQEFLDISKFKGKVLDFTQSASNFFKSKSVFKEHEDDTTHVKLEDIKIDYLRLKKHLKETGFENLRTRNVFIPVGLNAPYINYIAALEPALKANADIVKDVLGPFARYLAENINNPDAILRGNGAVVRDFEPSDIDGLTKRISKNLKAGAVRDQVKLNEVFLNTDDILYVYKSTEALNEITVNITQEDLITKMREIGRYMDSIHDILEKEENKDVSKRAIDILYKLTYSTARELEFYATVRYQLKLLNVALTDTYEVLKK